MIRVIDDGVGMDRDDALLSLERHATSKIRSGQDLARIRTLGFRGEALPSIASVSRFRMSTRLHEGLEGTEITVNGGKIDSVRVSGEAPGTQIEVRSLFYNLPARRKFLRSENTEASHVQHQLSLQAIGHPNVGFVSIRDQTMMFQAPPARTLGDRIRDLRGSELFEQLLEIESARRSRDHCFRFRWQSRGKSVHESGTDSFCEWSTRGKHHDSTRIAGGLSYRAHEGSVPGDLSVPGNGSGGRSM